MFQTDRGPHWNTPLARALSTLEQEWPRFYNGADCNERTLIGMRLKTKLCTVDGLREAAAMLGVAAALPRYCCNAVAKHWP